MRYLHVFTATLALTLVCAGTGYAQQSAEELYQAGLYQEEVQGDLERAITVYQQILTEHTSNRVVAAKAQLHIGICYETLGLQEAQQAYQRVVANYGDQSEVVRQARARLAALSAPAAANRGPVARRVLSFADIEDVMPAVGPSPDGRLVAYINTNDGGVYVRDVVSGDVRQVASGLPATWNYFPVWSADGMRLAFSTEDQGTNVMTVKIVDVSSREEGVVPGTRVEGWIDVEDWSRDGRYLLCNTGEDQLALIAVDDGRKTVLTDSAYLGNGKLSPDGRFVAYAVGSEEDAQVFIQPVESGMPRRITSTPGGNFRPHWAPDGRAIAYQSASGIWVIPVAAGSPSGNAQLAVAVTRFMLRRWTETGLYYSQFTDAGQRAVPYQVAMDPITGRSGNDGMQAIPGDRPDSVTAFAWSPDLGRIAFGHRLSPEITIASANSGSAATWDLGQQGHPLRTLRWSSDGRAILYESDLSYWRGEGSTVMELDAETGRVAELFPRILHAGGFSLSADGRSMTFYRIGARDSGSASTWPSGGSRIRAVVVAITGQSDGRVVARTDSPTEVPFSSTVPPSLSPQGDRVLFVRQAVITKSRAVTPEAASLWVVGSDGTGARRVATAAFIQSAIWDPSARLIAYTAKPDMADGSTVLRVLEVATGVETEVPLPGHISRNLGMDAYVRLTNWSSDGGLLGMIAGRDFDAGLEFWVVQGLEEGGR